MSQPFGPHSASPVELKAQIEAERAGGPFVLYRDGNGGQRILELKGRDRVTVGRGEGMDLRLERDEEVSRLHAELERIGDRWTVSDDGLSRNGSYLNGERIAGRRQLRDGDILRFGDTSVGFRLPGDEDAEETRAGARPVARSSLTDTQRSILVALCRPFKDGGPYSTPAPNQAIAEELFLSVDAVKAHLRTLFEKFDVGDLPQNQKRVRLVELALESGVISIREL